MAGASLLALLDDIASVLDDVSVLTKVAAKKTAGVLGDDLALNAQQVSGVNAHHELPVVWAVFKGSTLNKCILVPAALAISAFAPWLVTPLLMLGGLYLCYEGVEKLAHKFLPGSEHGSGHGKEHVKAHVEEQVGERHGEHVGEHSGDSGRAHATAHAGPATHSTISVVSTISAASAPGPLGAPEKEKIKGAVRTDFILSAEIIAITLGTVSEAPFLTQVTVLVGIAAIMTIGVYGLVAGIVKLDDAGLYLSKRPGTGSGARLMRSTGFAILTAAPYLMKTLSIVGTAAMFLVGGGILTHGIASAHHWIEGATEGAAAVPGVGVLLGAVTPMLLNAVAGIVAGAIVLALVMLVSRAVRAMRGRKAGAA